MPAATDAGARRNGGAEGVDALEQRAERVDERELAEHGVRARRGDLAAPFRVGQQRGDGAGQIVGLHEVDTRDAAARTRRTAR